MKEFKGTPGPWVVDVNGVDARWNIDSLSGDPVAITNQVPRDKDWLKRDANTQLIASSPDLLSALQSLVEIYDNDGSRLYTTETKQRALDKAKVAIDKALGETK